jgi:hypothetical protein
MFERDGKDARNERVIRAMTRESLALLQKRSEGRLRDKYKVYGRRGVVDWGEEGGGACLDTLGEAVGGHNIDEERRVRAGGAFRVERARPESMVFVEVAKDRKGVVLGEGRERE